MTRVHIAGAGLAGLSAAVELTRAGVPVTVYEAAGRAGGRCRSFEDKALGTLIDNGNHLLMSGNTNALAFLETIGARDTLIGPDRARFPFVDLATNERWVLEPGRTGLPFWLLDPSRRVPGTKPGDYLEALKVVLASPGKTVADCIKGSGHLYSRFWEPLTLAALNTKPERGTASLLWAVLKRTFLKGEAACRPLIAKEGLGPSFVDPALVYLESRGAEVRFGTRVKDLTREGNRVTDIEADPAAPFGPDDRMILALPPSRTAQLLPDLEVPDEGEVIVNAHFRLEGPVDPEPEAPFLGLISSKAHWIFVRGDIVSITISAAGPVADEDPDALLEDLWAETRQALGNAAPPRVASRLIKEKRATFDQSPAGIARRKPTDIGYANLFLAGDWTETGLPATIEGAILSGRLAADRVLKSLRSGTG